VCAAIDRPDLIDDPRFHSLEARARNSRELTGILSDIFASAPRAEWGRRLDAHGAIWAPAQSMTDVIADPQARANGYFTTIDHPNLGPFEVVDAPFRFSRSHVTARGPAPEVGQHTEEVLLELGYSWEEISALREGGAL
jgi:crotonobetainyl-CoA:carnitine CoA-transferase CaiB-like acyl-CoA transferase